MSQTTQASVTGSAASPVVTAKARKWLVLQNVGTVVMWIYYTSDSGGTGLTTSNGMRLNVGATVTFTHYNAVYAITADASTQPLAIAEETFS